MRFFGLVVSFFVFFSVYWEALITEFVRICRDLYGQLGFSVFFFLCEKSLVLFGRLEFERTSSSKTKTKKILVLLSTCEEKK